MEARVPASPAGGCPVVAAASSGVGATEPFLSGGPAAIAGVLPWQVDVRGGLVASDWPAPPGKTTSSLRQVSALPTRERSRAPISSHQRDAEVCKALLKVNMVGAAGVEPVTSSGPSRRA
jgi:hypothetical protein